MTALDWLAPTSLAWAVWMVWAARPDVRRYRRHSVVAATPAIPAGTKPAPTPLPDKLDAPAKPGKK